MNDDRKTRKQLIEELDALRQRVAQLQASESRLQAMEETLRRQNNYLSTLQETTKGLIIQLDLDQLLRSIITRAGQLAGTSHGYIFLLEPDGHEMEMKIGIGAQSDFVGHRVRPGQGLSGQVWQTGQPIIIQDYKNWAGRPPGFEQSVLQAAAGVPLTLHIEQGQTSQVIGVIGLAYLEEGRQFEQSDIVLLTHFAELASIALHNARLYALMGRRALQLQTAAEVSRAATSILTLDELLPQAVELIRERFALYYVGIFLLDEAGHYAVLQAGSGQAGRRMLAAGHKLEKGESSMIGWCVAHAQARIALDVGQEAVRFDNPELPQTRSELALPLVSRGQVIGAMTVQSIQPGAFSQEDITTLQSLADQVANAIQNARLFEQTSLALAESQALYRVSSSVAAHQDLSGLVQSVVDNVAEALPANRVLLTTLDMETRQVIHFVEGGPGKGQIVQASFDELWDGLSGWVLRELRPALSPKNQPDPRESQAVQKRRRQTKCGSIIVVPLRYREKTMGTLTAINRPDQADFSQREVALMVIMANQAAVAIQNLQLFEETQRRINEMAILNKIGQAVSAALQLTDVLEIIYQQVSRIFDTTNFFIATYKQGSDDWTMALQMEHGRRAPSGQRKLGGGLTSFILRTQQPVLLHSVEENELFFGQHAIPRVGQQSKSWMGVPLTAGGHIMGAMAIQSYEEENLYQQAHLELFLTIAAQAAIAIQNARLFEETQQRVEQTQLLLRVSEAAASTLDSTEVMRRVAREAARAVGADMGGAYLPDESGQRLRPVAGYHVPPDMMELFLGYRPRLKGNLFVEEAYQSRRPVFTNNAAQDSRLDEEIRRTLPAQSILLTPMTVKETVIGGLWLVWWQEMHTFSTEEQQLLEGIVRQAAVAIENARLLEQARLQAEESQRLLVEQQQARALLDIRVQELDYLNDIGRKINETPSIPDFLHWVIDRIPAAFRYPDLCRAAIEFKGIPYGDMEARQLPRHMVSSLSIEGENVGHIWVAYTEQNDFLNEESALLGDIGRRVSGYIENRLLSEQTQAALREQQEARTLMMARVQELDCLNNVGRKINETPTIPDLLGWLVEHIPSGMRYPEVCQVAIEFEGQLYGAPEAVEQPYLLVEDLVVGDLHRSGQIMGQLYIAYTELRELLEEESTMVEEIGRRVSTYIENQRLVEQSLARARRERTLREITARVRSSSNPDTIMRMAVRELGTALGRPAFIRLGAAEQLAATPSPDNNQTNHPADEKTPREGL